MGMYVYVYIHTYMYVCTQRTATHCYTMQYYQTAINLPQRAATCCITPQLNTLQHAATHRYGVATISRLLKIIGLFCRT